jgi:hypothetical protein
MTSLCATLLRSPCLEAELLCLLPYPAGTAPLALPDAAHALSPITDVLKPPSSRQPELDLRPFPVPPQGYKRL